MQVVRDSCCVVNGADCPFHKQCGCSINSGCMCEVLLTGVQVNEEQDVSALFDDEVDSVDLIRDARPSSTIDSSDDEDQESSTVEDMEHQGRCWKCDHPGHYYKNYHHLH